MIAIDWGTTNLRAYLLAADGSVREQRADGRGILAVPANGFPDVFVELVGDWLDAGESRVLLAGMVGSKQGWMEAPYVDCPASMADIAARLVAAPPLLSHGDAEIFIVPGLSCRDEYGVPDVMRGEEAQILGLMGAGEGPMLICMPGTHSKWAEVSEGRIVGFRSFMTGEVFSLLRHNSILGRMMTGDDWHLDAFDRGVALGLANELSGPATHFLHRAFSARTLALASELAPEEGASYLSGLLIGEEIAAMRPAWMDDGAVELVGSEALLDRYERALELARALPIRHPSDIVAAGLGLLGASVNWRRA